MKVLVCGGRNFNDRARVYATLDFLAKEASDVGDTIDTVINGGAAGTDFIAQQWANARGVKSVQYRADWSEHGRAAGPIRNQRMLDEGKPDMVIAFPGGRGTADMVRRARAAGVPTKEMSPREVLSNGEGEEG